MRSRTASMTLGSIFAALVAGLALLVGAPATQAQQGGAQVTIDELAAAVIRIRTHINPEGRSIPTLGTERSGSGIVIGTDGLILTIGYLMLEAHAAEVVTNDGRTIAADVVGYDHETGFGLLKASASLGVKPIVFGKSAELRVRDPVLVASFGGPEMVAAVRVVAKREFAGSWEYLLDEAIFTSPPHPAWSGAALINREGRLVGVGSLVVARTLADGEGEPGNMFVPIDRLGPILAELIADGRSQGPAKPWLGLTTEEVRGQLLVSRVVPASPAEKAGVQKGDIVVGVGGARARNLADFYRQVWARGSAGATIPLDVQQNSETRRIDIPSMDRMDHLKLKSTF